MQVLKVIKQYGKTLEEVAGALGVTKGTFSVSINGTPNVKRLFDIANYLGCSPAEFFADWDTAPENEHRKVVEQSEQVETSSEPAPQPQGGEASAGEKHDDLPFGGVTDEAKPEAPKQAEAAQVLRFQYGCPHCGHQIQVCISEV